LTVQTENTNKGSLSCSRLPRVRARVDLSRSSIYDLIAKGKFPRPIKLGVRSVGWLDSEIEKWIRGRVEASRGGGMQGAMTILALVDLLDARRAGRGRFMARCPAHDDGSASLSIREGHGGRILIHCFAGCTLAAVLEAGGLRMADLFTGQSPSPEQRRKAQLRRAEKEAEIVPAQAQDRTDEGLSCM